MFLLCWLFGFRHPVRVGFSLLCILDLSLFFSFLSWADFKLVDQVIYSRIIVVLFLLRFHHTPPSYPKFRPCAALDAACAGSDGAVGIGA